MLVPGVAESWYVGVAEGEEEGDRVGANVGEKVGGVGECDGLLVGVLDGDLEGEWVGFVGVREGDEVVGDCDVGCFVGLCVAGAMQAQTRNCVLMQMKLLVARVQAEPPPLMTVPDAPVPMYDQSPQLSFVRMRIPPCQFNPNHASSVWIPPFNICPSVVEDRNET